LAEVPVDPHLLFPAEETEEAMAEDSRFVEAVGQDARTDLGTPAPRRRDDV
jgi:hypothetical protein